MLVYCSPDFSAIFSARCLWNCSHSGPIPRSLQNISMVWRYCARLAWSFGYSFSFSPFRALHKLLLLSSCFGKRCLYLLLWHRNKHFDHVSEIRVLVNQAALRHLSGRLWFHRQEAVMEVQFLHHCIPGGWGLLRSLWCCCDGMITKPPLLQFKA